MDVTSANSSASATRLQASATPRTALLPKLVSTATRSGGEAAAAKFIGNAMCDDTRANAAASKNTSGMVARATAKAPVAPP